MSFVNIVLINVIFLLGLTTVFYTLFHLVLLAIIDLHG